MSASIVERNTIIAYGGLATPLAMIGYPIYRITDHCERGC